MLGDCECMSKPVLTGARVCLVYDIYSAGRNRFGYEDVLAYEQTHLTKELVRQVDAKVPTSVAPSLADKVLAALEEELDEFNNVVIALSHCYQECKSVEPGYLKGADQVLYDLLKAQRISQLQSAASGTSNVTTDGVGSGGGAGALYELSVVPVSVFSQRTGTGTLKVFGIPFTSSHQFGKEEKKDSAGKDEKAESGGNAEQDGEEEEDDDAHEQENENEMDTDGDDDDNEEEGEGDNEDLMISTKLILPFPLCSGDALESLSDETRDGTNEEKFVAVIAGLRVRRRRQQ